MYIRKNKELFVSHAKFNSYDVDLSESEEHDKKIKDLFFEMRRMGCYLAVRQKLINGNKPDIAILSVPELIIKEVLKSESIERFNSKDYLSSRKIKVQI